MAAGARVAVPCSTGPRALGVWLAAALASGAAAALGLPVLASAPPPLTPPEASGALRPGFVLSAPDGTIVSERSLAGAPYVAVFGHTRCGAPCTARLERALGWQARHGADGAGGRLPVVFITLDPEYDTPARMAAFAGRAYRPVVALTGSRQATAQAARSFGAVNLRAPLCGGGSTIIPSSATYLVGADGRLQAIIAEDDSETEVLARLRRLPAAG